MHISQQTRCKLISGIGEKPPLDEQLKKYMRSPEVLCFMTPLHQCALKRLQDIVPSHTVERNRAVDPAKAKERTNFSRKVLRQVPALGPLSKRCSPTCQTAAPASCRTVNGCVFLQQRDLQTSEESTLSFGASPMLL